jgi:hypothetical protein
MNRMSLRKRHTPESQHASSAPANDENNLIAVYQELCNRHQQIDDFRGKLLALLPIASGAAALALLLNSTGTIKNYLIPIGIYGCAITIGLFIYELHGISVCKQIMKQAGHLEDSLNIPGHMGQYRDQNRNLLHRIIEVEMASWVVYLSVLAGWVYIAGARGWWDHTSPEYFANPIWIAGIAAGIVLVKWIYAIFIERWVQRNSENSASPNS